MEEEWVVDGVVVHTVGGGGGSFFVNKYIMFFRNRVYSMVL